MPVSIMSKIRKIRVVLGWTTTAFLLFCMLPGLLSAQYQKKPPDFGGTHAFPAPAHPEPTADWMRSLDVGLLAAALVLAAWLVFKNRNRKGMILLSIGSVAY